MTSDLLNIGSSGLLGQQKMLATTSSNISNVNTTGYTRQNTVLVSNTNSLGVGDSTTRRLYDTYAQSMVWQDTASYNQLNTAYNESSQLDKYLSNSAIRLSDGLDNFFSALQSANSSPNSTSSRQSILSEIFSIVARFQNVSADLTNQAEGINSNISTNVDNVNSVLSSIATLNQQIIKTPTADDDGTRANLLDQRDELIRQLSEKMDIRTVKQDSGAVLVNLGTGQSLVTADSAATISVIAGDPDPQKTQLQIQLGKATATLSGDNMGGELGGYFAARTLVHDTQNQIGQLSLAFADAMNEQNKLGMTQNNSIGTNIFTLPSSSSKAYSTNTGSGTITVSPNAGEGALMTPNDFVVKFTSATAFDVYVVDGSTQTLVTSGATGSAVDVTGYGVSLTVSGTPASGDKFLLQPTRDASSAMAGVISRAEDLALASPLQLNASSNNYSQASISLTGVYNTNSATSAFTSTGLATAAPHKVVVTSAGDYEIYDGSGTLLGTAAASTNGQNLLASAGIYADPTVYPGFEISIDGTVSSADQFTIAFNTDGFSDNSNGLAMAKLQTTDLVRKGDSTAADNKMTFSEAFASVLTSVGTNTKSLSTSLSAADAKLTQSQELFSSVAGVNLDEEAANLLRFQQAYAASAKVITTAKDIFDTLIQAVR